MLARDLGRRGEGLVVDDSAVADGEDVGEGGRGLAVGGLDLNAHVVVDADAAGFGVLDNRSEAFEFLVGEASDQGVLHQSCTPDHHSRANLLGLLLDLHHQLIAIAPYPLEMVFRLDSDAAPFERLHGVVCQVLVKHG